MDTNRPKQFPSLMGPRNASHQPTGILDQCMALPYHLYVISTSGTDMEAQLPLAYGTALVLIMIILLVNLLANALRKYFEKRVKTN